MSPHPIQKCQFPQPIAAVLMWLKWSLLLSEQLFRLLQQVLSVLVQNQTAVRCIRRVQLQQRAGQRLFSDRQAEGRKESILAAAEEEKNKILSKKVASAKELETEILEITLQKQFNIF